MTHMHVVINERDHGNLMDSARAGDPRYQIRSARIGKMPLPIGSPLAVTGAESTIQTCMRLSQARGHK